MFQQWGALTTARRLPPLFKRNKMHEIDINTAYLKQYLARFSVENFGVNVFTKSRKKPMVFERYNAMYVLKQNTRLRLADIGFVCSNGLQYDHATVIHAIRHVETERTLYGDREKSISMWSQCLFRYLGHEQNVHLPYLDLFKKIKNNLKMDSQELKTLESIEGIVINKLFKHAEKSE